MITPILIQIVFWLGVAACVIQGGLFIAASFAVPKLVNDRDDRDPDRTEKVDKQKAKAAATQFSIGLFAGGVSTMIFGPLLMRIIAEQILLLFKIHDELKVANDRRGRT